ncbi:MAG: hypothetical protein HY981_00290 [Candidatus Magasanikbacteria bacterium]|nr:hypothetical protein [Candidatus Magasanikbacteria bacterium]
MKHFIVIVSFFAGVFLAAPAVYSAGAGGGGGSGGSNAPSCTEDTWDCTAWSACSSQGKQTRACMQTFDCPFVFSTRPAEEQSCAPSVSEEQKPQEVKKQESAPVQPACTEDIWKCGEWATQCDASGAQHRACGLVSDCASAKTPAPTTDRACAKLQCGNTSSMKARIECRLKLSAEAVAQELAIQYLPEECRALKKGATRIACVVRYKALKPCWEKPEGEERFACARGVLKLGPVMSEEVKTCKGKKGKEQVACKAAVREKVFSMVKFRLYDLSERAEEMREKGVSVKTVSQLVYSMEFVKQQFNRASSAGARRAQVAKARSSWKQFVSVVKKVDASAGATLTHDNLDQALIDLKSIQ